MKIKIKKVLKGMVCLCSLLFFFSSVFAGTAGVIGNETMPIKGNGSTGTPYVYLIDEDSKVTWKHLNKNKEKHITEIYECRENGNEKGKLLYSWLFEGAEITEAQGPYFLGLHFYDGESVKALPWGQKARYFSFATKRDFPGKVKMTLNAASYFKEGSRLYLYYYGGYDDAVVHGEAPAIFSDEILIRDNEVKQIAKGLIVQNSQVSFDIRHGGNYFLTEELPKAIDQNTKGKMTVYDPEQVLGTIKALFYTPGIAKAVASYFNQDLSKVLKQGDIDSIKRLYLSQLNLKDTKELVSLNFEKLEGLVLSDNQLSSIDRWTMPALRDLDISHNQLSHINELTKLTQLEHLSLEDNQISVIPDFGKCQKLITLNLKNNKLKVLPKLSHKQLLYLDVSNNQLIKMPDLSECTQLKKIELTNQTLECSAAFKEGQSYRINPIPELIAQYGQEMGIVQLFNEKKELVFKTTYKELAAKDFYIDKKWISAGKNTLVITGFVGISSLADKENAEILGTYTYHLNVKRELKDILMMGVGSLLLLGIGIGVYKTRKIALLKGDKENGK